MSLFARVFPRQPALIGMIHVWRGDPDQQLKQAVADARCLYGFDGLIVENYGWGYADRNWAAEEAGIAIGQITKVLVRMMDPIPVGINVLPNDYEYAFGIARKCDAHFIQLDHVTGEFEGVQSVDPIRYNAMRRRYLDIAVLGGIQPKYYRLAKPEPIGEAARRAIDLTDAIVVTGDQTGEQTRQTDLEAVRMAVGDHPIIIGSGFNAHNAATQLRVANGAIVGTALKRGGVEAGAPIDPALVTRLLSAVRPPH